MPRQLSDFEIDLNDLRQRWRRLSEHDLPAEQELAVQESARTALMELIAATPVETGRARAGWVAVLEQLGGSPPAGWMGSQPIESAIEEGLTMGHLEQRNTESLCEVQLENSVPYVPLLDHAGSGSEVVISSLRAARQSLLDQLLAFFSR